MHFVYSRRAERFGLTQADELGSSEIQAGEARYRRSTLAAGIWVIQPVIVEVVICRKQTKPRIVAIYAKASLIVAENFAFRRRRKRGIADVRCRNVLQQMLGRFRPRSLWNHCVRKHALRTENASRRVVRLIGRNRISEFLR